MVTGPRIVSAASPHHPAPVHPPLRPGRPVTASPSSWYCLWSLVIKPHSLCWSWRSDSLAQLIQVSLVGSRRESYWERDVGVCTDLSLLLPLRICHLLLRWWARMWLCVMVYASLSELDIWNALFQIRRLVFSRRGICRKRFGRLPIENQLMDIY